MNTNKKICLVTSDDDQSKRQLHSLANFEELNNYLDIFYIKQSHLGGKDFKMSWLTKLINDVWYARYKTLSKMYDYFYTKYTGIIFKLFNEIIGSNNIFNILVFICRLKSRKLKYFDDKIKSEASLLIC